MHVCVLLPCHTHRPLHHHPFGRTPVSHGGWRALRHLQFILGAAGVVHDEFDDPHDYIDAAFDLFVASLLLLILGIPEGLPVAISLTLVRI